MFFASLALASPLTTSVSPLSIENANFSDTSPADGSADGWSWSGSGLVRVSPSPQAPGGPGARLSYQPGTRGQLCSAPTAVGAGKTAVLRSAVKGDASLSDITALHLHLGDTSGKDLVVAKRRFDPGAYDWQEIEILATVPKGASRAWACVEFILPANARPGSFELAPLQLAEQTAESRTSALSPRRILLLTVEAFRHDHVHAYGYPRETTPNLDRAIGEGLSLDRHVAAAPYTHPSLAGLISGILPTRLGFADNTPVSRMPVPTAAEYFAEAGYVTAAFSAQYVLTNRYGLNRGFHYYRNHPNDTPAATLHQELFPFLEEHGEDNLFLWVHYFEPHGPYRPPPQIRSLFGNDALALADKAVLSPSTDSAEGAPAIPNYIYDAGQLGRAWYVAGYDGDIRWLDGELGRLFELLRKKGWDQDTLVLLTADHGESMTDHNRYFCHGSLYAHDLHVPAFLWGAGIKPGKLRTRSSHLDLLPTLLARAGAPIPGGLDGISLLPWIEGQSAPRPELAVATRGRGNDLRYAVHDDGDFKIVVGSSGTVLEAYDHATDPEEKKNLVNLRKEQGPLLDRFKSWRAAHETAAPPALQQALSPEDEAMLRALGYIE